MQTNILIIGGGLAGLSLAHLLESKGCDWQLLESRERWGGRILTTIIDGQGFDLGPSWFWPGQPRIDALIKELKLNRFEQTYRGELILQDDTGAIHRGQGIASMQGAWRLKGGMGALIDALVGTLPAARLHPNTTLTTLRDENDSVTAITSSGMQITANKVVLSLPPRIACGLNFSPALSQQCIDASRRIPTWMAGHAKAVATYKTPFWKEAGLSGDAVSRQGPLVEIHDASPDNSGPYALFGFVGTPASHRQNNTKALKLAIKEQLGALFGAQGADPETLLLKDWAFDTRTAMDLDHRALTNHPIYGRPAELQNLWNDRLHFGSTEMGSKFGGFLEGALETAYDLAERVVQDTKNP